MNIVEDDETTQTCCEQTSAAGYSRLSLSALFACALAGVAMLTELFVAAAASLSGGR